MNRRYVNNAGGFSLLELMVVVSIIGLITGVVVASFSGGIRVWESARVLTHVEQELYFAVESVRKDLVNTFKFHGINFSGAEREMSFPSLLEVSGEDGMPERKIGSVRYVFNPSERTLSRYVWAFPADGDDAEYEIVAGGVRSVLFGYLDKKGLEEGGAWQEVWRDPTNFPAAVKMDLVIDSGQGAEAAVQRQFLLLEGLWRTE